MPLPVCGGCHGNKGSPCLRDKIKNNERQGAGPLNDRYWSMDLALSRSLCSSLFGDGGRKERAAALSFVASSARGGGVVFKHSEQKGGKKTTGGRKPPSKQQLLKLQGQICTLIIVDPLKSFIKKSLAPPHASCRVLYKPRKTRRYNKSLSGIRGGKVSQLIPEPLGLSQYL